MLAVILRPYFPVAAIALAAVVLAALAVWGWVRSYRGAPRAATIALVMRLVLIVAASVVLMGPSVVREEETSGDAGPRAGAPGVTFLVDTSTSMATADMEGQPRIAFAVERWLNAERLRRAYGVRVLSFDSTVREAGVGEMVAEGEGSEVVGSVASTQALVEASGEEGAVVVISDGRETGEGNVRELGRGVAVHTVTLGGPSVRRDVAVTAVAMQEPLLAGEEGQVVVRVSQSGAAGERVAVRLRGSEGPGNEEVVREVVLGGGVARVELPVKREEPGEYVYEAVVDALPGEADASNNARPVFVEVTAKRLKVLLLEGEPHWDTRFLAQALRRDDRVELMQVVQVSEDRQARLVSGGDGAEAEGAPRAVEDFKEYDVVVLGRGMENVLTPGSAKALAGYVEGGGRVVLARGRACDSTSAKGMLVKRELAGIEPVVWGEGVVGGARLVVSEAGRTHPMLAEGRGLVGLVGLPGAGFTVAPRVEREKAGARVLMWAEMEGGARQPGVVAMQVGRGVVLGVLGEGLWRWRMRGRLDASVGGDEGRGWGYDRFWSNGVRWVVLGDGFEPGGGLSMRLSRRSVRVGKRVMVEVGARRRDEVAGVRARVVGPGGEVRELALGEAGVGMKRAEFEPTVDGVYRVIAEPPEAGGETVERRFHAYELDAERVDCSADPGLMRTIAETTGGRVLDPYRPGELEALLERATLARVEPGEGEMAYVWDRGWVMAAMLGWMGCEWLIRRKGGLV